jgi:hypothetical protein
MASWIEIDRIRKDPVAIRSLAKRLLKLPEHEWSEWEIEFLHDRARQKDEINTRQAEKLLELRDDAEYHSKAEGFSVGSLIENCWLARDDLQHESDRIFVESLKGRTAMKRRQLRKLFACSRELNVIEDYIALPS